MPTRFNSSTDAFRQNEADLLANGKDDTTLVNAGRTPILDIEGGLATTVVSLDGDLRAVDTTAEAIALDPAANTTGAASAKYSRSFLLRWLIKLLQPLAGTVSSGLVNVAGPLTDTQLRATAVPVSLGSLPSKRVFAADLTLDTAAYAVGDTLGSILEITNAVLSAAGTGTLQSITVIDDDDQGQPFDLVFFNQSIAVGALNFPWVVSDADMASCLGIVRIESADFVDLGPNRVATITPPPIGLQPASGTSIFVGTVSRGTGTYTAAGLRLVITIERD